MTNVRTAFSIVIFCAFANIVIGQNIDLNHKNYVAEFVFSAGTSSIIGDGNRGYTQLQSFGSYDFKDSHFYEFGISLKKQLKRNSLSMGLHTGAWSTKVEGHEYIIPENFFEGVSLSEEKFEGRLNFQRLSVPISYIIEPRNNSTLNIRHELGITADLMLHNNYEDLSQRASSRITPRGSNVFTFCGEGYTHVRNVGVRLFYGVSANVTPRLSIESKIKFGGFASQVGSTLKPRIDSFLRGDSFYAYFHESFEYRTFEMGLGLKYAIF